MAKTPAQIQQEQENRKKNQQEIQDKLALIAAAEERKKQFALYKDKQASLRERDSASRSSQYARHEHNYQKQLEHFKNQSFNSTYTWTSAQMAIAQLCLMHLYKQQALTNKYLGVVGDYLKTNILVAFRMGRDGLVARFSAPPEGDIELPALKCALKVGTDANNNPTIRMTRTMGDKSLEDFLAEAGGLKDVAQFSQQTQTYFDKELELWLEKHGYALDSTHQTVTPIAPNTQVFSEEIFKTLNRQDPFENFLQKDMPRINIQAEREEHRGLSPK